VRRAAIPFTAVNFMVVDLSGGRLEDP